MSDRHPSLGGGDSVPSDRELGIDRLVAEPMLHEPILLVHMTGWIDAAGAAAVAAKRISDAAEASPIVRFDDDTYIDYRARRPTMELRDGVNSNLAWPTLELRAGRTPGPDGRDVLVLTGPEPDMAWHRFARAMSRLAVDFDVKQMIALGAYPFAAPHTREPRLSVSSPSTEVLASVSFARSSVDVPAGMAAVLEHTMHALKIPALGVWSQVPHYITSIEYPAASVALLDGFREVTGIDIESSALSAEADETRQRLDAMVSDDAEHRTMLAQLEELFDAAVAAEEDEVPSADLEMRSGDELAAEIQQFLRDQ
ncbi:MAG: PAC2 family protein [Actinomycetota bacterium]